MNNGLPSYLARGFMVKERSIDTFSLLFAARKLRVIGEAWPASRLKNEVCGALFKKYIIVFRSIP